MKTKEELNLLSLFKQVLDYKTEEPKAHFSFVTIPRCGVSSVDENLLDRHQTLLYDFAELFDNS